MKKKIIGLVGETGSGKDAFCRIAEKNFSSVLSLRFSKALTTILGLFFDEVKKEDQQWLANKLRDRFGEDILMKAVAKKIETAEEELIIVNGARVKEEIDFIRQIGGKIIYITAGSEARWKRIQERGEKKDDNVPYEKFLEIDNGRTETQIKEIGKMADFAIENGKDLNYLEEEIEKLIEKL